MNRLNQLLEEIETNTWAVYAEALEEPHNRWQVQITPAGRCAENTDPWFKHETLEEALEDALAWAKRDIEDREDLE